jgi:hypothetical protein
MGKQADKALAEILGTLVTLSTIISFLFEHGHQSSWDLVQWSKDLIQEGQSMSIADVVGVAISALTATIFAAHLLGHSTFKHLYTSSVLLFLFTLAPSYLFLCLAWEIERGGGTWVYSLAAFGAASISGAIAYDEAEAASKRRIQNIESDRFGGAIASTVRGYGQPIAGDGSGRAYKSPESRSQLEQRRTARGYGSEQTSPSRRSYGSGK